VIQMGLLRAIISCFLLLCFCGCVPGGIESHPKRAERRPDGRAAARQFIGSDPSAEFRKNRDAGVVLFYSTGSLVSGDSFPGLSQEEVDRWITHDRLPFVRKFQDDPPPFFVGDDFSAAEYWDAVSEYLTAYNRLVLEEMNNRRTNKVLPGKPTEPSPAQPDRRPVGPSP